MTKIVFISDTHTKHRQIRIPECDLLIHCGDFTYRGKWEEVASFNNWLDELVQCKNRVVVAGNHELGFEQLSMFEKKQLLSNAIYLEDSGVQIEGLNIWGSPWTPKFFEWQFMLDTPEQSVNEWNKIPDNTNILVTHGPSYGILDKVNHPGPREDPHVGCKYLLERVKKLTNLKIHASGHLHESYGMLQCNNYLAINAANLNDKYNVANEPIVIEI